MLEKRQSNKNTHLVLVGVWNGIATWEDSLGESHRSKHILTIQCSTPWCLPKGDETLCPCKSLRTNAAAAFFIIAKSRKQPTCSSVDEWIIKLWYLFTM